MAKRILPLRSRNNPNQRQSVNPEPKSIFQRVVVYTLLAGLIVSIFVLGYLYTLSQKLPTLDDLINPKYDLPTRIYDRNGELITEFYTKRRVLIPIEKVPKVMIDALIAIEDSRFYYHFGIDPIRMVKAMLIDIVEGRFAQGASTLTQQTAKMFLLTPDKQVVRKIKEVLLALKIESQFTKDQILELYLNKTYFGAGAYGIEEAAQTYFSKTTQELNLAEAAMIAGMPQAPSNLSPTNSPENATKRRNLVLKAMEDNDFITKEQQIEASISPIALNLNKSLDYNETSYYMEHIRRYLYEKYGKEQLYSGGLRVYTMMDLKMQVLAQNALRDGLIEHDRRQGYRGPVMNLLQEVDQELNLYNYDPEKGWDSDRFKRLDKESKATAQKLFAEKIEITTADNHFVIGGNVLGVVTKVETATAQVNLGRFTGNLFLSSMSWARPVNYKVDFNWERLSKFNDILKLGDVVELELQDYDHETKEFSLVLTQNPIANGGFLAMNPQNGEVLALVGGYDFRESEFNRAIQGKRQTGSAFKPIAYSLALEGSFTPSSMLDDTPYVGEGGYKPDNYSKSFKGKMSLRDALVHSENTPSLRIAEELGINAVIEHTRKLGITADLPRDLTIVLGTASLTLEEMTIAFSTFANGGKLVTPTFISRIEDRDGVILEQLELSEPKQVLGKETSFLMTSILQDVVRIGTGWKARAINRPSAGKTGTTNNYTDAWYIGYVPQLIAGVYIGFDTNQQTLGESETGSRAAAPIWINFMSEAITTMPILPFEQPDGINMVKINPDSGLLACDSNGNSKYEYYKAGTEPTQCHRESVSPSRNQIGSGEPNQNQELQGEQPYIEEL